jgi:ubiquinone/menaquinone biosynthesis C-methylase UbiE
MGRPIYDEHTRMYIDFVDRVLAAEPSLFGRMLTLFEQLIGSRLKDAHVLDIACGEGYLSRFLTERGALAVTGIDISSGLIDVARDRSDGPNISFRVDDAQELATFGDGSVDIAVSQMAMMDIADHVRMFEAVHRVLQASGAFVFSLLHPCFEGPYHPPDENPLLVDENQTPVARVVRRYASEGYWRADGAGVRGHVGSYHRTLSTYLNDLVRTGFRLEAMAEPVFEGQGLFSEVPRVLIVSAVAS